MLVDTGSANTIDLFPEFWRKHRLLEGRAPASVRQGIGFAGPLTSHVATLRSISIAGVSLADVPASFADETPPRAPDGCAGTVGGAILSRFRVIFDGPRDRISLVASGRESRPFSKERFGLQFAFEEGALRVTFVAPNSPADAAGWAIGDTITAVNGIRPSKETWWLEWAQWSRSPAGKKIVLTDGAGRERKLTAADYY